MTRIQEANRIWCGKTAKAQAHTNKQKTKRSSETQYLENDKKRRKQRQRAIPSFAWNESCCLNNKKGRLNPRLVFRRPCRFDDCYLAAWAAAVSAIKSRKTNGSLPMFFNAWDWPGRAMVMSPAPTWVCLPVLSVNTPLPDTMM